MGEIHCCDCLDYLKTCPNEKFDLVIADPPYFRTYGQFDFGWKGIDEYLHWCKKWISEIHRVTKPTGSFYLWGVIGYNRGFPLMKLVDWIEEHGMFKVRNWITQRNCRGRGNKRGFMAAREELVFMTKSDNFTWNPVYTSEKSTRKDPGFDGKPRKNTHKRCSDVWIDIAEASQSPNERFRLPNGTNFPTVKAIKLCNRIIEASSNKNDMVYIPFGGSGSEAVSCEALGRQWTLTEYEQVYIDHVIRQRLGKVLLEV